MVVQWLTLLLGPFYSLHVLCVSAWVLSTSASFNSPKTCMFILNECQSQSVCFSAWSSLPRELHTHLHHINFETHTQHDFTDPASATPQRGYKSLLPTTQLNWWSLSNERSNIFKKLVQVCCPHSASWIILQSWSGWHFLCLKIQLNQILFVEHQYTLFIVSL